MNGEIPLSRPDITEAEIKAVTDVMRSARLSIGPRQMRFEELVADRCQRRQGVAVSSGTAGLHLILLALGVGPGDEVITTPFSFVASANCILYVGARPKFVDIDPVSMNMDPKKLEAAITEKTKAIIAVEVFGNPAHMDAIEAIANRYEIALIEDSCEGLGGKLNDRPIGNFGRASVFGFYPNKQITTGEGGMIVTDDDRLADLCRSMRNQGRAVSDNIQQNQGAWLTHERLGYNYRLSEIAAAVGVVQMERLDELLARRREVAMMYLEKMIGMSDVILSESPDPEVMSWFVYVIRLSDIYGAKERDRIIQGMRRHEVGCSNYFPPIHLQPFYREQFGFKTGDFPVAEAMSKRTIALPFYNQMDSLQVELVVQTLKVMLQREQLLRPDDNLDRGGACN